MRRSFLDWVKLADSQASVAGAQAIFWQLAAGRCTSSPFDERHLVQAREEVDEVLRGCGVAPERGASDRRTEVNFRRLAAMLEVAEDPDYEFLREFASVGATLGVDVLMPRTPAVFEEKTSWNLPEAEGSFEPTFCENYSSATANMDDVRRQVEEGLQRGSMVAFSREEALQKFGGQLAVAALGAVPKEAGSSVVRIIHDATHHVEVNPRIRVRDRLRSPMIDDLEGVLRQLRDDCKRKPAVRFGLKYDVSRAHNLVPIREEDWKYQAFCLDDPEVIYMHTVGAFGFASAAYHWQRLAAAAVRLAHYLCELAAALYHLLYADDGLLLASGQGFWLRMLFWLYVLEILEIPLSWKKVAGGTSLCWIGYQLDVATYEKGIGPSKVAWLCEWVAGKLRDGCVQGRVMKGVLGRLSFVAGALPHVRPFLGPIYAWVAQLPQGLVATLPLSICLLLEFIKKEVERAPMTAPKPLMSHVKDVFRIDAKAEGDKICVGGWESFSGDTQQARWFSVRLDKKSAPWAYVKGEPFRAIAALELVATLVAVCVFGPGAAWRECTATAVIAGFTDNAGNTFVVDKMMTTAFPLSIILMELAAQLDALGSVLSLSWVPREQNVPADALTNEEFGGFDPRLRVSVDISKLDFRVLPRLMDAAMQLDSEIRMARAQGKAEPAKQAKTCKRPLRLSEPW